VWQQFGKSLALHVLKLGHRVEQHGKRMHQPVLNDELCIGSACEVAVITCHLPQGTHHKRGQFVQSCESDVAGK